MKQLILAKKQITAAFYFWDTIALKTSTSAKDYQDLLNMDPFTISKLYTIRTADA